MIPSRVLLDSHVLIWLINQETKLGQRTQRLINEADQVYVSAASIWELSIKAGLGKIKLPDSFEANLIKTGFIELPVNFKHAAVARDSAFKLKHNDPFDRLLVAQATLEGLTLLTADEQLVKAGISAVLDARL